MTDLNPGDTAPEWGKEPWWKRVRAAVLLLSVHGFITKKQSEAAYVRISEWAHNAEVEQKLQNGIRSRKDGWG